MMTPPVSDTEVLIAKAGQGDQTAQRELFERHRHRLRRMVAIRMDPRLASRFDPSDVVQEAMLTASFQLREYAVERPIPFYPWLRQIAWKRLVDLHHHHLTAQKRSVAREVTHLPDESALRLAQPFIADLTSPLDAMVQDELRAKVRLALESLPDLDREILVMRHLEQMSVSEIAALLNITESAVKMRRLRAVRKFRDLLAGSS